MSWQAGLVTLISPNRCCFTA